MQKKFVGRTLLLVTVLAAVQGGAIMTNSDPETAIIERERKALTRWGQGDPFGYIEVASEDITYFDPSLDRRLDGRAEYKELLAPLVGKTHIHRFEMHNTKVQLGGDIGVLTFNLVNYNENDSVTTKWNSTETYRLEQGQWMLLHSHWSYTKPNQE